MKSWLLTEPGKFVKEECESPPVDRKDLAKIKLDACMVSAADLLLYGGLATDAVYPIVPGRQGAGVVSEIEPDNDCCLQKGDRVIVDPFVPCGVCLNCKTNRLHLCTDTKFLGLNANGLYTNFKTLPCNMLHRIPEQMSNETALFTEYVAIALSIIDKINLCEGDHVAIFSANKLGFILAQLVAYYQAIAIVVEHNEEQVEKLVKEQTGFVINPKTTDLTQAVKEVTGGRNCEKVVYIANPATNLNDAAACCGFNGVLCIAGTSPVPPSGDFVQVQRKQLTIVTANNGYKNYPSAINLLATKTIKSLPPITEKIAFNDIPSAFEKLDRFKARYSCAEIVID